MPTIQKKLMDAVTSPSTSAVLNLDDINATSILYQATVVGTGAVSATVIVEVSLDGIGWLSDSTSTLSLSGTTVATLSFNSIGNWSLVRARCTAISGTEAALTVTLGG
jgi:hypothetical protein